MGRTVHRIYAPCLQVAGTDIAAPSFSIPIADEVEGKWLHRYIVIRCDWFETPATWTDYWQLQIIEQDKPDGIEFSESQGIVAPCTLNFYRASPVTKIDIYTYSWPPKDDGETDPVEYDRAVLFHTEDGKALCLSCQLNGPGAADEVHFSGDDKMIAELLDGSALRLSVPV